MKADSGGSNLPVAFVVYDTPANVTRAPGTARCPVTPLTTTTESAVVTGVGDVTPELPHPPASVATTTVLHTRSTMLTPGLLAARGGKDIAPFQIV